MMTRVIYLYIVYLGMVAWMLLSVSGCANIMAPTGGAKDTLPPTMDTARSYPKLEQLNYKDDQIELYFNEWIKAPKLKQELIITPRVKDYTFKISKKRLRITFLQPLDSNTTYNLDFRESIQDITEGNPTLVRLAFSTGSQLDTMEIKGKVMVPLTNKAAKKTIVALYKVDDTLKVDKDEPYYLTQTNDAGIYHFKNIKANRYRLYAIQDANNNKYYNKNELIGFAPEIVDLSQGSQDSLNLNLVQEDYDAPRIIGKLRQKHYFEIKFNEGVQTLKVDSGQTNLRQKVLYNLTDGGKKLTFYNMQGLDSLRLRIIAQDSAQNRLSEEVNIRFNNKPVKEKDKATFKIDIQPKNTLGIVGNKLDLTVKFSKPVVQFAAEKLQYLVDADTVNLKPLIDSSAKFEWNQFKTQLNISRPVSFKNTIKLIADSAAFVSAVNDSSQMVRTTLNRLDPTKIGLVNIAIETQSPHFIIQLLNQEFQVVKERKSDEVTSNSFKFDNLAPGSYSIRIIIDENNNGKWDFSNYKENKPAENITFYRSSIQLRANWEQNITLKF
ncbi:Ig-like domain-containing protein [uncultured Microscilla sp.]|uniref:Ig-like domain-containing protein n=1 Tax=uncultured Microscilla sp. TaxID=432653 RepID=UPI002635A348|nr:Ig-like domain-containing protein [uncultured Microscilla sp.]